jgi:hypothetical protein
MVTPMVLPTASTAPSSTSSGDRMQIFREIMTALISFVILIASCYMMLDTYVSGKRVIESQQSDEKKNIAEIRARLDAFGRQKDILLYGLGLLGTVTGYYLGRVPAELRANTAQNQVTTANNTALQATAKAAEAVAGKASLAKDTTETLNQLLPFISQATRDIASRGEATPSRGDLEVAEREIESLLRRISA